MSASRSKRGGEERSSAQAGEGAGAATQRRRGGRWTLGAFALVAQLAPRAASAQCTVEARARVTLHGAVTDEHARVTLANTEATVEMISPLAFRVVVPASRVRLFLGAGGHADAVVAATRGVGVRVASARGDEVTATLFDADELAVRGVRLPCRALSATYEPSPDHATPPRHPENPRWASRAQPPERFDCARVNAGPGSAGSCLPIEDRCRARDGTECGYHPRAGALRVYAAPRADAAWVELIATRDVVLVDEDGRPGWLRVRTQRHRSFFVQVRGWVRARDVAWAREVPPAARRAQEIVVGRPGRRRHADARVGFVVVAAETEVADDRGAPLGRTGREGWCTAAEQRRGAARVSVALPGAALTADEDPWGTVPNDRVTWVDACSEAGR